MMHNVWVLQMFSLKIADTLFVIFKKYMWHTNRQ